jgi:septal ring factor EnvC (AmiA/AmiB activator)
MRERLLMLVITIFPMLPCLAKLPDRENSAEINSRNVEIHMGVSKGNILGLTNVTDMGTRVLGGIDVREPALRSYRRSKSGRRASKRWRSHHSKRHSNFKYTSKYFVAKSDNSAAGKLLTRNFEKGRGHLPWPVSSGTISMKYGLHEVYKGINHNSIGITIETDSGTPVTAVSDGQVQSVFNVFDKPVVMVRHGNYYTTYTNLSVVSVAKDEQIKAGQELGKVSDSGQLDFIISDNMDNHFDPEKWLKPSYK